MTTQRELIPPVAMKHITFFIILMIFSHPISAQDSSSNSKKFARNLVKAIRSDKKAQRILMSHETMNQVIDSMFEKYVDAVKHLGDDVDDMINDLSKGLKDLKSDSAYKVIHAKMKEELLNARSELRRREFDYKKIRYLSHSQISQPDEGGEHIHYSDIFVTIKDKKTSDTLDLIALKCVYFDGNWHLGNDLSVSVHFTDDIQQFCRCVLEESQVGCDYIIRFLENKVKTMSEEDMEQLMKITEACVTSESDSEKSND